MGASAWRPRSWRNAATATTKEAISTDEPTTDTADFATERRSASVPLNRKPASGRRMVSQSRLIAPPGATVAPATAASCARIAVDISP